MKLVTIRTEWRTVRMYQVIPKCTNKGVVQDNK